MYIFCINALCAQQQKIDSLLYKIKISRLDTNRVILLNELVFEYKGIKDYINSEKQAQKAITLASKLKYDRGLASANYYLALIYNNQKLNLKARDNINEAIKYYNIIKSNKGISSCYNILGNIEFDLSDMLSAKNAYASAYNLAKQINHTTILASSMYNLARLFSVQGNDSTVICFQNAKQYYLSLNKKNETALCDYYTAAFYFNNTNYQKSELYHKQALITYQQINDSKNCGLCYMMIGACLQQQGLLDDAKSYLDSSLYYFKLANYKAGLADYYYRMGKFCQHKGEYEEAINQHKKSFDLFEEIGNRVFLVNNLVAIGAIYQDLGNYSLAQTALFKGLKISEEINDKTLMISCYIEIGNVFEKIYENKKALDYNQKGLVIAQEINKKGSIAILLNNIGYNYEFLNKYDLALENLFKSLKLKLANNNEQDTYTTLNNIGRIYERKQNLDSAEKYTSNALYNSNKYHIKKGIAYSSSQLSRIYFKQNKIELAENTAFLALNISKKIKTKEFERDALETLYKIYQDKQNTEEAYKYYREYILIRDSLYNTDKNKDIIRTELNSEFLNKELLLKSEQEKKDAIQKANFEKLEALNQIEKERQKNSLFILEKDNELKNLILTKTQLFLKQKKSEADQQEKQLEILNKDKLLKDIETKQKSEEIKKQKIVRNIFIIGVVLLLFIAFYIYKNLKRSKKANQIIAQQKKEVEFQKHMVDEKQKEIIDSINYAKRIQYSLLAGEKLLNENLSEHFLFFKPKDLVSGDFYWGSKLSNGAFALVTADSTGHGVPGAIMSMLNISCLNEAINSDKLIQSADILNSTRKKVIEHLSNDGSEEGGKDGMDCSLVRFDFKNKKLVYAAANNPVWIIRDKTFIALAADRMPVGKHDKDNMPFTQHEFDLQSGDMVYTLTDGFPDQFGGPKGKKFKYKQLEELLISISHESMKIQKQKLEEVFKNWQGDLEQVDDVCVIGIRI